MNDTVANVISFTWYFHTLQFTFLFIVKERDTLKRACNVSDTLKVQRVHVREFCLAVCFAKIHTLFFCSPLIVQTFEEKFVEKK